MQSILELNLELLFLFFLVQGHLLAGFGAFATFTVLAGTRAASGTVASARIAETANVGENRSPVIGRRVFHDFLRVRHDRRQ